jgi:glycosyltransferase involved in cell wall biosynthesis
MKKILQFIDNLDAGGKERHCVELTRSLSARGDYEVQIVCMREQVFFEEIFALPRVTVRFLVRRTRRDPRVFVRFMQLCRELQPDVITVWDLMTAVYALPAARLLGIGYVSGMTLEAPLHVPRLRSWMTRLVFTAADAVVANSRAGLRAFDAPARKSIVIHNGYDFTRAAGATDPLAARRRFGIKRPLVVGMVATFSHFKDYPTFIRAARIVLGRRQDVAFVAVGSGPTLDDCRAMLSESEREHVLLLGRVDGPVEDVISMFDIGVLATFTEGISNSIIEYMVLEKPVVATDGGGTSELVVDGETGMLVAAGDAEQLADRLCSLLDDAELRRSMGRLGRRRIERHFAQEQTAQGYCELYDGLIAARRARS